MFFFLPSYHLLQAILAMMMAKKMEMEGAIFLHWTIKVGDHGFEVVLLANVIILGKRMASNWAIPIFLHQDSIITYYQASLSWCPTVFMRCIPQVIPSQKVVWACPSAMKMSRVALLKRKVRSEALVPGGFHKQTRKVRIPMAHPSKVKLWKQQCVVTNIFYQSPNFQGPAAPQAGGRGQHNINTLLTIPKSLVSQWCRPL